MYSGCSHQVVFPVPEIISLQDFAPTIEVRKSVNAEPVQTYTTETDGGLTVDGQNIVLNVLKTHFIKAENLKYQLKFENGPAVFKTEVAEFVILESINQ
jgi:hypothetical protein